MSSSAWVADATSITGTTGPNVSSLATTISGVTPSITVASAYKEVGKSVDRRPPQQIRAPAETAWLI